MPGFSLINDPWIPAAFSDGTVRWLRPREIVLGPDLPVDVSWGRPDLRVATYELLIGLLTVALPPEGISQWAAWDRRPPAPEVLDEALALLEPYFRLDGDGPRFLQDFDALVGEALPADALLIDMQGEDGTFFTKAGRHAVLSRAAAAVCLYAFQAFAPAGGRGNRTSMRGGGPLTTLAFPPDTREPVPAGSAPQPASLWRRLWLNVPILPHHERAPEDLALVFPWAAPTRTSETNRATSPEGHADRLQAYFGMPRRVRLVFEANADRTRCAITGRIDDVVVTGFVQRPYGPKYEGWQHRLTPYYAPKPGAPELLPLHPRETPIGYRQWIGLLYDSEGGRGVLAETVREAKRRVDVAQTLTVLAAGYVMDNMKVVDFAESDLPLHVLADGAAQKQLEGFARRLIGAADTVAAEMRKALAIAIEAGFGSSITATASASYWARTEVDFRRLVAKAAGLATGADADTGRLGLQVSWRTILEREALAAFDGVVPLETLGDLRADRRKAIIDARKTLIWFARGYSKAGAKFLSMLGVPAPTRVAEATDG